ncbi:MAG: DUF3842 family protein [Clostridiaceae bacterium]|nr:DUF3842 family protein [Clostridiaceae bacterium]
MVVIDGQGGGLGRAIIERIRKEDFTTDYDLTAVGTNALATAQMLKAGADGGATGESAVIWNCGRADIIIGGIGIIAAGSMLGELSPAMATAIGNSRALKILIPLNKCHLQVAGAPGDNLLLRLDQAIELILQALNGEAKT